MRAVVQRVSRAEVRVDGIVVGAIGRGLLVFLGVAVGDTHAEAAWLAAKIPRLRIFSGAAGTFDQGLADADGAILVVSQFTLLGDARKGRRPDFTMAAPPAAARALYEGFIAKLRAEGFRVEAGVFGATMEVELVNDGPVTILIERAPRAAA